jgi:hypothetical protein
MPLQLRYEMTAADQLAKLERYAADSVVSRRFLWSAYFAICGLAWLSATLFYVKQGDRNSGYVVYAAAAAAITVCLPRMYRWYQKSFWASVLTAESLRGLIGPVVLTADEDVVEEAGPVATVRGAWRDVVRVDRDAERTLIFLAPLIAIAVPRGACADDAGEEFDRLVRRCTERIRRTVHGT